MAVLRDDGSAGLVEARVVGVEIEDLGRPFNAEGSLGLAMEPLEERPVLPVDALGRHLHRGSSHGIQHHTLTLYRYIEGARGPL